MSELGNNVKSIDKQGQDSANEAVDTPKYAVRSARMNAGQTIDKIAGKVDEVRSQAAPALDTVSDQAQKLLQQGREKLSDAAQMIKEKAIQASDQAVAYTKDEPIKAVLIAVATGAVLMGLVTMMTRSRD